jgi:hypothetical protein
VSLADTASDEVGAAELAAIDDATESGGPTSATEMDSAPLPAEEAAVLEASGEDEEILAFDETSEGGDEGQG